MGDMQSQYLHVHIYQLMLIFINFQEKESEYQVFTK